MKRGREELTILAALFVLASAQAADEDLQLLQFREPAMGTMITVQLYAEDEKAAELAARKVFERFRELEAIFSDYDGDSEVLRFCHEPPGTRVKLSPELHEVLTKAKKLAADSEGAFDVTIGTLIHLWRRADRDQQLPSEDDLKLAFSRIGDQHLKLHPDGTGEIAIDHLRVFLGGIAKGYAADEGLKILREAGFPRAVVAASGDIAVGAPPPNETGWRIGLTSLASPDEPDRFILLANAAVSTSGDSQQFLEFDGVRYSHIVDPETGLGLTERRSVSVIAPDATTSDSLATALSVLGPSLQLLEKYPGSSARFVDEEGETFLGKFGGIAIELDSIEVSRMIHALIVKNSPPIDESEMKAYEAEGRNTRAKFTMLPIPGGEFLQGSPEDEPHRKENEGPQRKVEVEPFWMGKFEVTWNEYEPYQNSDADHFQTRQLWTTGDPLEDLVSGPSEAYTEMSFGMGLDGYPAISMTQHAALKYCQWISAQTGHFYRLPTEAEWEYACRAGTDTAYSWGDDEKEIDEYAWYFDNSNDKYQKVGKKLPNPWGLHDMHGNVLEWTLDAYFKDAYTRPVTEGASGLAPYFKPGENLYPRTVRGGSWYDYPEDCRSAWRIRTHHSWKKKDPRKPKSIWYLSDAQWLGFRIVRPLKTPSADEMHEIWNSGRGIENELED